MDVFDIWTVPGSPFARAVMATLEEKGLPWRIRPLAPMDIQGPGAYRAQSLRPHAGGSARRLQRSTRRRR